MRAWNPELYDANARFVSDLGAPVVALLAPRAGERILDLGCGDGALTKAIADSGAQVLGIDADANMIEAARREGVNAEVGDGMALDFEEAFDAVFTNAALHWMPEPDKVAAGVYRALKLGGRYVGEFGGFGNIAAIRAGLRAVLLAHGYELPEKDPQYYASPAAFEALLTEAGFSNVTAELIHRPTPLPTGLAGWLETFRTPFFPGMALDEQRRLTEEVCRLLEPILKDETGIWFADYVRLRFRARKES